MQGDAITVDEVEALLGALVAIPSINPELRADGRPPDWFGEAAIARFVADWLRAEGIDATLEDVEPDRPNVVARLPGRPGAPRMIWEGHLDTVQVDGMDNPFVPRISGGRLYARGAVDDKGCLAMFMLAMRALRRETVACDLTFLAAVGEEVSYEGVTHHVRRYPPYDLGIAGEPTGLTVMRACKGVIRWTIDVLGRSAHASKPRDGVNAITVAGELLTHLDAHIAATPRSHPLLGGRTLTCTIMQAGEGPNTVPPRATLTFDFRILPDQTGKEAWSEIAAVVAAFELTRTDGARLVMNPPFVDSVSMDVPEEADVVQTLQRALRLAGYPGALEGAPFGSDASKLTRNGTPCVIFGPGSIEQAHSIDEHVELREVSNAANILVAMARSL